MCFSSCNNMHVDPTISAEVAKLPPGPLDEASLRAHVFPLFSRVLARKEIYLANHSLGRPLDVMSRDVQCALDAWYVDMDDAWGPWLEEMQSYRAAIAQLIGCARWDCVVPKTAAGQGLRAVLNSIDKPCPVVVASTAEFDSLDFILRTYAHKGRADVRWVATRKNEVGIDIVDVRDYLAAIDATPRPDLVVCSQIYFQTGQHFADVERVVHAARSAGALSLVDTYHSAGVIDVHFDQLDCDFAVGGNYKYTRGGPGACWLAIHPRWLSDGHSPRLRTLDTGWFAKKDTFKYERPAEPLLAAGGDAWLESTMPVLPFYQARSGLHFTLAMGVARLREYSLRQQAFLRTQLAARGVPIADIGPAGAYTLVPDPQASAVCAALKRSGVNTDSRGPAVRLCPDVLTTQDEMREAAAVFARVLREGAGSKT
jgi:kynureninase